MLKTYCLIAWRKLFQRPVFSIIVLAGLSISLTVALLMGAFWRYQYSFDRWERNYMRTGLFRQFENSAGSGSGFAQLFRQAPEVEATARVIKVRTLVQNRENHLSNKEVNFCYVDSCFPTLFDLQMTRGSVAALFEGKDHVLLAESTALRYFGSLDIVGKPVSIEGKYIVHVAGVFRDLPANSHLSVDVLANFTLAPIVLGQKLDGYWDNQSLTYILLKIGADKKAFNRRLPALMKQTRDANAGIWKPQFIPLKDIYLKSRLDDRVKAAAAINEIYIFASVAGLILLLAALNYVNITTAKFLSTLKEFGVRKIVGAQRRDLIAQILVETCLTVGIAGLAALAMAGLALPLFDVLSGIHLPPAMVFSPVTIGPYAVLLLFFSIFAGLYPAFYAASFAPTDSLRQKVSSGIKGETVRKILVFLQFNISVIVLVAVGVVWKQLYFIQHVDLGYDRQRAVVLTFPEGASSESKQLFLQGVGKLAAVNGVSQCGPIPGEGCLYNKLVPDNLPPGRDLSYQFVYGDTGFLPLFNIRLLKGENFSTTSRPDQHEFLINRTMSRNLGWGEDPIGKSLGYYSYQYNPDGSYREVPVMGKVIGLIDDYHQANLHAVIGPMLIQLSTGFESQAAVKIDRGGWNGVFPIIEHRWKELFPEKPLEFSLLEDSFNSHYAAETSAGRSLGIFAAMAIVISCMGLFGLSVLTVQKKRKEIGVRRILGASTGAIFSVMSREFLAIVLLSMATALPLASIVMRRWLESFAYRTTIDWRVLVPAALLTFVIASATVGRVLLTAARENPARSLRGE